MQIDDARDLHETFTAARPTLGQYFRMRMRTREKGNGMLRIHDLVRSPLQSVQPMSSTEWGALLEREGVSAKRARRPRMLAEPPRQKKTRAGRKPRSTRVPQVWEMLQWPRTPEGRA